jgi:DNA-binding MarR family transcriptional regulator
MQPGLERLQQELRQTRPFSSLASAGVIGLIRSADVVRRAMTEVVAPHGITLQQYNVLRILRGAGDTGLPTLEIAARMVEATPGITRLLDRLEAKTLVRRERCKYDRRQVLCWITPAAVELLEPLDTAMDDAATHALRALDTTRLTALIATLDDVRAGLAAGANPHLPPCPTTEASTLEGDRS